MYAEHFGSSPLEVSGDSPQPKPIYPAGGDQPAVNPGSDTYPLDVSAALSDDRRTVTIAVVNPSDAAQSLHLTIQGVKLGGQGKLWQLAPDKVDAMIEVGKKSEVRVEEKTLAVLPEAMTAPPYSVNILSYPVQ
jgi:alpha-N-arabinofuranosidase